MIYVLFFTLLCGASERFYRSEAPKRIVKTKHVISPLLISLGQQGLALHFVELPTYAVSVSLVKEIPINKNK